jgi:DNA invertase Pin-like site-specific DNA recombinase
MNELWVGYARVALAACRDGDTLVVTKLDRLARSLPDTCGILDELTRRNVKLSLGGSIHDPTDPVGRLLFNVLAMVAEFESDVIRLRMREGMKVAKAKGWLRGKQPKAVAEPGETLAGAAWLRELHRSRARRTVQPGAINDLPHHRQNAA